MTEDEIVGEGVFERGERDCSFSLFLRDTVGERERVRKRERE